MKDKPRESSVESQASAVSCCVSCGYDLRGSASSRVCSECGFSIAATVMLTRRRLASVFRAWRFVRQHSVVLLLSLLALICVLSAVGHAHVWRAYSCDRCGRVKQEVSSGPFLPFLDACLVSFNSTSVVLNEEGVIPVFLDPSGDCDHNWIMYSHRIESLLHPFHAASGRDPSGMALFDDLPHFTEFLKSRTDLKHLVARQLRDGDVVHWLSDEYWAWRGKHDASARSHGD